MSETARATNPMWADFSMWSMEHWRLFLVRTIRLRMLPTIPKMQMAGTMIWLMTPSIVCLLLSSSDMLALAADPPSKFSLLRASATPDHIASHVIMSCLFDDVEDPSIFISVVLPWFTYKSTDFNITWFYGRSGDVATFARVRSCKRKRKQALPIPAHPLNCVLWISGGLCWKRCEWFNDSPPERTNARIKRPGVYLRLPQLALYYCTCWNDCLGCCCLGCWCLRCCCLGCWCWCLGWWCWCLRRWCCTRCLSGLFSTWTIHVFLSSILLRWRRCVAAS